MSGSRASPSRPSARLRHLVGLEPRNPRELRLLVRGLFGIDVMDAVREPGSTPPMAYLSHAFFESAARIGEAKVMPPRDAVVWANRGGGKTVLGAMATLLDLIYKPGVEVRVLGGSLEQSTKMYEQLLRLLDRPTMRGVLATKATERRVVLGNGSRVEVLAGSQRSVRGVRVHKLRCDEVEDLDPAVWDAAQRVTRSGLCGGRVVSGSVEALSTMHRPGGLMNALIGNQADRENQKNPAPTRRVFRWTAMDVVARCPAALPCEGCVLWDDCGGRAKHANGFVPVDDLIAQWHRSSRVAWEAEMMCRRPGTRHAVFPMFDVDRHVVAFDEADRVGEGVWVGGMDFGLRAPTVLLWGHVRGEGANAMLHLVAEYDATDRTLPEHVRRLEAHGKQVGLPPAKQLAWLAIDPAGLARNAHSGRSDASLLREAGFRVKAHSQSIATGIETIRRRLDHGQLLIDPRCVKLIAALRAYHFDPRNPNNPLPIKDGPDHWCDALRYLVTTLDHPNMQTAARAHNYL